MQGALSRAEVFAPRSGETWRDPSPMYTSRGDVCSAARDTIPFRDTIAIAGLLGRTLDALSIRRDQRQVLLDNPAVVPAAADRFEPQPFAARVLA